jgi:hypothetical protein
VWKSRAGDFCVSAVLSEYDLRMALVLRLAAVYNVVWGGLVVLFPLVAFEWAGLEPPRYPEIWQCLGMVVGVYGVGYWIAARDPLRHWPIVLVGLLGKVFGPIGFLEAALRGALPWRAGWTLVTNDLIWWVPFAWILFRAWGNHRRNAEAQKVGHAASRQPPDFSGHK